MDERAELALIPLLDGAEEIAYHLDVLCATHDALLLLVLALLSW